MIEKILNLKQDQIVPFIESRIAEISPKLKRVDFIPDNDFCNIDYFIPNNIGVCSTGGLYSISVLMMDDQKELYYNLIKYLKESHEKITLEVIMNCVCKSVFDYIGGPFVKHSQQERMSKYKRELPDSASLFDNYANLSDFRHSEMAYCTERAAMVNNLLRFLGLNSYMVYQKITIFPDAEKELHSFNVIKIGDECYIFDTSLLDESGSFYFSQLPHENYTIKNNNLVISNLPVRKAWNNKTINYTPFSLYIMLNGEYLSSIVKRTDPKLSI